MAGVMVVGASELRRVLGLADYALLGSDPGEIAEVSGFGASHALPPGGALRALRFATEKSW